MWVSIQPEIKYEGFGGGPLLVGGLLPLNPALRKGELTYRLPCNAPAENRTRDLSITSPTP